MIANQNKSDKGSSYLCAHCYTYVYEVLLEEFSTAQKFSLLEIGLNRDGKFDIPSLKMWRSYFGARVDLYGFDIDPGFLQFDRGDGDFRIIIGDQSNPEDLLRCFLANPAGYDVIIDDGYHASAHQQITLRTLWNSLKPGGMFIIENLHYQPIVDNTTTTRDLILRWKSGELASTKYIDAATARAIVEETSRIEFFDSCSFAWPAEMTHNALVVLWKQA